MDTSESNWQIRAIHLIICSYSNRVFVLEAKLPVLNPFPAPQQPAAAAKDFHEFDRLLNISHKYKFPCNS